jgi:multidrug efflux pump
MAQMDGLTDLRDSRAIPGLEWHLAIDRTEAAREGVDLRTLERNLQLLTRGVTVGTFRPADVVEPMDIRVRFVPERRSLEQLRVHRVATGDAAVPLAGFVEIAPRHRSGAIERIDQRRVVTIEAGVEPGVAVFDKISALRQAIAGTDLPPGVEWRFGGQAQERQEQVRFLGGAFVAALLAMLTILLIHFDSFRQVFIVMSAIVFSTAGVLVSLMIAGRPFGVVMSGVGTIALAGIVVNNNIVLIDRFNALRRGGMLPREAALRSGAQRLRPVLLTTVTTVAGLMPMALGLEIDILRQSVTVGAPFTQLWTDLSTAIAGGLALATLPTLLITPAMLTLATRNKNLMS